MGKSTTVADTATGQTLSLWWLTAALFLSYLTVAMPLPVISVYATGTLGFSKALAGAAVGAPFATTILTRLHVGRFADRTGGRPGMTLGLAIYVAAALVCLASGWPALPRAAAYGVLLAGRLFLGLGESLTIVSMLGWGIALAGPARAGRFMALMGMGMYGAYALGAPLGLVLFQRFDFQGLMLASAAAPLIGLAMIRVVPRVAAHTGTHESLWRILGKIGAPGAVVGLQGVGFATIGAFLSLYFINRGWPHASMGLTAFALGFVAARLVGGRLPDRLGGVPVTIVSLIFEVAGLILLWRASGPGLALAGALVTGLGCSLVFPAMGLEVVRRVAPQLRATAMGGFSGFQDLAYAATAPFAGWLADRFGFPAVFLLAAIAAAGGLSIALGIASMRRRPVPV